MTTFVWDGSEYFAGSKLMGVTNDFSVDGEVIAESGASGYLSYHRDNLGSVCATLDSSGALVHQYQYKPFGELWSASGAGWYMDCINSIWNKNGNDIDEAICGCHEAFEDSISNSNGIQHCAADIACGFIGGVAEIYCSDYYKKKRGRQIK
ncbi:hypothetical protein CCB80_00785 [Armatimonadetes bacterium Uphvl-Ar1]|nr:hypothetical protein CCB80_00785 [Armatimonadetes bacterium Uphvl-Ar1]